ncbi:MAG: hypothetical protein CMO71_05780 [Verrucomicrobiales bacterium]|nr:hypothetical protein [Verrucomicrobiales bacterium]
MNYQIIKNWEKKIIYVDIDETICNTPSCRNYERAVPNMSNIDKINKLSVNNEIVYWTARGTGSGINWEKVTIEQFENWGVKCQSLKFNKPVYDIFIDDKNVESKLFFNDN